MLFQSYSFVFIFLPLCLLGYYGLPFGLKRTGASPETIRRALHAFLILMSLIFYASFGWQFLGAILVSMVVNYGFYRLMLQRGKPFLIAGVIASAGMLLYCKLTGQMPLAISFYTFSQISFLVDAYRERWGSVETAGGFTGVSGVADAGASPVSGTLPVARASSGEPSQVVAPGDYALYILFFPKLLQGPITKYADLKRQFDHMPEVRFAEPERWMRALYLFTLGLSKKVLLADLLAKGVDYGYANLAGLSPLEAFLTAVSYSLQIYFDFSGYCDMGQAVCEMMGIELPMNFDAPYKTRNILEFWKHWHISLTKFFTSYVYIPLGGNRKGTVRTLVNMLLIFLISGFWHGTGWTFLIWGAMHGMLYVVLKGMALGAGGAGPKKNLGAGVVGPKKNLGDGVTGPKMPAKISVDGGAGAKMPAIGRGLAVLLNFLYVTAAWVFFRAETVADAVTLFAKIFTQGLQRRISLGFAESYHLDELWYVLKVTPAGRWQYGGYICMWAVLAVSLCLVFFARPAIRRHRTDAMTTARVLGTAVLFVWSVLCFSNVATYIYLNF